MTNSRLVVLGATGFVGSHLTSLAQSQGLEVLPLGSNDLDLRHPDASTRLSDLLREADILVNCAAIAPSKSSNDVAANLSMAQAITDAARLRPVAHQVLVSSDAVYGTASGVVNEECPCNPDSLHGVMSLGRELIANEAPVKGLTVLRPAPIYGDGDTHNAYGPNRFARQALESGMIEVFGKGEARRDHVTVGDVATIAMKAALQRFSGILNVASGNSISFSELAVAVGNQTGATVASVGSESLPTHRAFDTSRLARTFPDVVPTTPTLGIPQMLASMKDHKS